MRLIIGLNKRKNAPSKMLLGAFLFFSSAFVHSDTFKGIQPGSVLDSLKSLDGTWQSPCRKVNRKGTVGYQQDYYTFRLINLTIKSGLYKSERCAQPIHKWSAKFTYTVGNQFRLATGEAVREFNIKEISDTSNAWNISPYNIVLQNSGKLMFGLEVGDSQGNTRLDLLDYENTLVRHY